MHKSKDICRDEAIQIGQGLRASSIKYRQAKRTMQTQGLKITTKEYYNLIRSTGRKTPQERLTLALKTLEMEGFHIRCFEKYIVEENIRQRRVVEHFFFCHPDQIRYARRFVSTFSIQTDATFNTNHLNMPLSVLIGVTNTMRTFPVAYCYVTSESTEAFIFIKSCLQDLVFHDRCPGPAVIIGDFSAGLTAAMLSKQKISRSEAGMDIAMELEQNVDSLGSSVKLQLCCWHAAEAVKKRLTVEGYPKDIKVLLNTLIWKWIKAPTMSSLIEARSELINQLRPKEADYLVNFYRPREHQLVYAYTRLLPNLGARSTQRTEGLHPMIKNVTARHTSIQESVRKVASEVKNILIECEDDVNNQRHKLPRRMDRRVFANIGHLITHEAIDKLISE